MPQGPPTPHTLLGLTPDGRLLFLTRCLRMFAYGFLSVVLVLYLKAVGLEEGQIGLLLTLTLLGDTAVSLWITTSADRVSRRGIANSRGSAMLAGGLALALTTDFLILLLAATVAVISPSGNEVGPFLSIEQAALAQTVSDEERTRVFAWYNVVGQIAAALGALAGGFVSETLLREGYAGADIYRPLAWAYGAVGLILALGFTRLSPAAEAPPGAAPASHRWLGLHRSHGVVFRLAGLFALDAFGGGFVVQSFVAYWFHVRFGANPATLGAIFFGANILAAVSSLAAASLARRFGLINTMVFTHLPSNVLLLLVPLMPTLPLAILVLLLRFSISQMDVPTRQSYTMAVVAPDERSAAAGITGVARSIGAGLAPFLVGLMFRDEAWLSVPFFVAGGTKILYDVLLWRAFAASDR
ncbi:MAG: MFS transporter [Gemmataceae bacterium]